MSIEPFPEESSRKSPLTTTHHFRHDSETSATSSPSCISFEDINLSQTRDDLECSLELAEKDIINGNISTAERILISCYADCLELGPEFDYYRLQIAVRLGDMYFSERSWERAVCQYDAAYQIWYNNEGLAENESSIHPAAFIPRVAECYAHLGVAGDIQLRSKADRFVALYRGDSSGSDYSSDSSFTVVSPGRC